MTLRSASFALLLVAYAGAPARAQGRGAAPPTPAPAAADSTPKVETAGEKEEKISQTTHAMRLDGAEYNFAHLGCDPTFTDRVSFTYYEAGHMIYIRPSEHKKLKADIAKFIQGTRSKT
jgi:carboxypeptidase C (cathepsin A)